MRLLLAGVAAPSFATACGLDVLWTAPEVAMTALTIVAGVLSLGLLVYLGFALLFPEKLS